MYTCIIHVLHIVLEPQHLFVGVSRRRVCVLVLVLVSIAWIPIVRASQGSQLFVYIMTVSSFLQPPICAVYLLAVFWKRTNEKVATAAASFVLL